MSTIALAPNTDRQKARRAVAPPHQTLFGLRELPGESSVRDSNGGVILVLWRAGPSR